MPVSHDRRAAIVALVGAGALFVGISLLVGLGLQLAPLAAAAPPLTASIGTVRAELTRVDLFAGGGEARYRSLEVLAGRGANEAVGTTGEVTGSLLFNPDGTVLPDQSKVRVDLRTLQSDNAMRDRYIQRMTLQTVEFPTAEFMLKAAPGLPMPLPTSGTASFELVGDLTLHGITRPTTWQATAVFSENEVTGYATTTVLLTEFGMEPPRAGPVLSIEDAVRIELDVKGTIAPSLADLSSDPT
jgi:polyisoprenoid-binding protein YceI